jgi:3-dehydroshikimate dehydratase
LTHIKRSQINGLQSNNNEEGLIVKFSVFTDMLGQDNFEESLKLAKSLGFSLIDLRAKLDGDTIDTISEEKCEQLKGLMEKYSLQVNSLSSWAVNPCAFGGPPKYDNYDQQFHVKMRDILARLCNLADIFEAPFVRVYSLYRQEDFDSLPESEKEAQYRHNANILRGHADYLSTRDKILLVENEPPTLTSNARELGLLARYADHPNLKINWDIVNEWRTGNYPTIESYEHVKGYLYQTHLKGASRVPNSISDNHPNGDFNNFAIADQDDFEHSAILKEIDKYDPHAVMTIDTHYPSLNDQDKIGEAEVVRRSKVFFESILKESKIG